MSVPIPYWYWFYAVPYLAVLVIVLRYRSREGSVTRLIRLALEIVGGFVVVVWSLAILPGANKAMYAYRADATCRSETMAGITTLGGGCRVVEAGITRAWFSSARYLASRSYYLQLALGDGKSVQVRLADDDEAAWNDVTRPTPARAQLFRGKVVLVQTDRGTSATSDRPDYVVLNYELWLLFGLGLLLLGLAELVRVILTLILAT